MRVLVAPGLLSMVLSATEPYWASFMWGKVFNTGVTTADTYLTTNNLQARMNLAGVIVSIAVTPANPSVALGLSRQFTATATFDDATTMDITAFVARHLSGAARASANGSILKEIVGDPTSRGRAAVGSKK